ncbi:hypothetical protein TBR22_A26380 [Luteitalea sp. TBR-22]|uniref:DUF72 domain-containing protein n=1 Tax=Luteitalea sp. TBR-22 TaxID=2802971 RepID=UPI001AF3024B|nr:DUF72 domain-containing protein [Luteitalea sp. TBR-22]BCS33411.1 hypothetical protein TBR22_A26380 [Luteitalea sp. TBR-22]
MPDDQLSLFDLTPPAPSRADGSAESEADWPAEIKDLGARIPPGVRFGTSSWSFPGWAGLVYRRPRTQAELAREGLREYARYPLFGTVGIDRSYYAPLTAEDLRRYASQLPPGFPCCAKVPAMYASPVLPGTGHDSAAVLNPDFLSPEGFLADVVEPALLHFARHVGPFVLEIPPVPPDARLEPHAFADKLGHFLDALPRSLPMSVELRDRRLLTPEYGAVLRQCGAAHVLNYWSAMPFPGEQAGLVDVAAAPFMVVRLLLRPGTRYEARRDAFRPFNRVVEQDDRLRRDVTRLITDAAGRQQPVYVLVNNKAEGSAPLTIRAIAEQVVAALEL